MSIGEVRAYQLTNMNPHDRIHYLDQRHLLLDRQKHILPVKTKQDFYRRFYAGEFGNHGPMWATYEAWQQSGYRDNCAIRSFRRGGPCTYHIQYEQMSEWVRHYQDVYGHQLSEMNWSAMAPTHRALLQGEVARTHLGLTVFASRGKQPIRDSLRIAGQHWSGLPARLLLRSVMDAGSLDWLEYLLDTYVDHVIEFSSFEMPWGVIRGQNTVIWECRNY